MTITIRLALPLIVAAVGAFVFLVSDRKVAELGKYAFAAGALAFLLAAH